LDRTATLLEPGSAAAPSVDVPLVVDLDGTLLRSDTLVESLFVLAHEKPLTLLMLPLWLARGRAHLKRELGARAAIEKAGGKVELVPQPVTRHEKAKAAKKAAVKA